MANSFFHRLSAVLWSGVVLLLLFLAVYVSVGRLLVSSLDQYRDAILQELNLRVPFTIEADSVAGEWRSFNPVIVMSGLRLTLPESTAAPLELTGGQVGVDVWNSLRTRSLQATHVIFEGLSLHAEFSSEGKLRLRGLAGGQGESGQWLQDFLVNARHLSLRDNLLRISLPSGELREFDLNLQLHRKGSDRRVEGKLTSTRGTDIAVLAEGVGNPFRPEAFSGELYIDMQSSDFGAVQDLLSGGQPALWTEGELDVALWLSWDRGVPSVATRVNARDLLVTPREGDWRLPLERIAFEAHVVNERDRLTLYATDVEVDNGEVALQLPGLQLDAWGSALRLRARDIPVATMSGFVAGLATTPEPWRQLITDLDASGSLSRLQLDLAEYERPFDAWEFEANFAELALAPYKGAPGASAARGHVQLDQDGGTVVLDGRDMSLDFPRIYRHSLDFDELFGTLHLHWDAQSVGLSSDLLTAVGEEGMVKALFGLDIPLQPSETGVEMELLVGLEDVHPRLREKYIPETLDDGLRKWLQDSIGDGLIREGAFLWRGALKSSAAKLRTVQLGFNVSDTQIEYHPDWPAATLADGVIMIDDGRVRAWSNSARMLDSQVSDLSVAVAPGKDKRLQLDVAGGIDGPASDVLSVINESPLADIVGDTFSEWRVQGAMRTDLDLRLQLGEGAPPPEVAVATRWRDVDATISPGDVTLRRVSGALDYTSAAGFSSSGLAGSLWDRDVALEVRQLPQRVQEESGESVSPLEVTAATRVAISDLRGWLDIEPLALADGEAPFDLSILVVPGQEPLLRANSSLQGISLDLPQPWNKSRGESAQLQLEMEMSPGVQALSLTLDDAAELQLQMAGRELRAGALGLGAGAPATVDGVFNVSGRVIAADAGQWFEFIRRYFLPDASLADGGVPTAGEAVAAPPVDHVGDEGERALRIVVSNLGIGTLSYAGQSVNDVLMAMTLLDGELSAYLEGDWLAGILRWPIDSGRMQLELDYVDMSRLSLAEESPPPAGEASEDIVAPDTAATGELPVIDLAASDIYQGEKRLGEIALSLRITDTAITVDNIVGEIARLRLPAERPGRLEWRTGEEPRTLVEAQIAFKDVGSTLEYFGYENIIQTRKGRIDVDLAWPGSPQAFALAQGSGSLMFDIGSGSFRNAPAGAAGALRVVSILNLVHIVQRLSVTQVFDSGIPFDSVEGEVFLHEGTIEVPLIVVKGGSRFEFSGVSEVASQSLNGELVATLPVAKNLPWVAALAAGLPVAAGVFVVSKIFDKQVNRLSSAVYKLKGTWDEPNVTFDRMFDDSVQKLPSVQDDAPPDPNQPPAAPVPDPNSPPAAVGEAQPFPAEQPAGSSGSPLPPQP